MIFGKHINRYYLRYAPLLLLGLCALVAVDYFQLLIPELYGMVINGINKGVVVVDGVTVPFDGTVLWRQICLPLIIIIVVMITGRFAWRICFFIPGIRVERSLREKMFDHCKTLPLEFYQRNKVGNLMSLFTNDLETVQECFGWGVMMTCDAAFLGVMSLIKMFMQSWQLTLFSLIPMALMVAIGIIVGRFITKKWDARQAAFSDMSDFAQESFSGIAVIKAFVKEFKELMAFRWLNKKNEKANVEYTKISTLLNITVTLFVESVICVILGYGGYLVYQKIFDAGQLMEYIGYFNAVVWPVMAITELIDMTSRGKASLARVSQLLDTEQTVCDAESARDIDELKGNVTFQNLTFRYPDADYDALSDVSFQINAGESVGIIGKTGSGKTTVADLILRCYNVSRDVLFVDGMDVNDVKIASLRNFCAYVPQDNYLFGDTIANNIAFASDQTDMDKVQESARLADVDGNIAEFQLGYETMLGERGVTVSGGQKQRISIARALMKDAPILILDDSVSAVDTDTEKVILSNLRQNRKGKTTILIAHRVSTVQQMDKVLYLDNGKVMGYGSHEELVADCAEYRNMVELQKLEEEREDD
ncbi:MAG: ABC transporter ATP-binding protein/permease [Corallococcus sp.]|nr:ABC transporter ATP-binding protein/permease [Corallococcus sp.]MCM1359830.1 ABC transporter ATP-binding protein/permease [Corallococcus sp.]MCM1395264.1 ABC transporter ATP-binding protein/permease [Corallococcus sp.]